ncbi:conserved protein of unknown function [Magnetospirillum sp. XM-1]|uniref:hypothetical protein n=1 Tax=Magnetospirillum sp. XM-1 TaxID=1663591 RepID=UPI00073DD5F3|nr:hypothetical protein [Magnetospirillum sp. XM-1]CUW37129.1 conserved protein of unknown function [Magnetospirillum sp. XM-1]
MTLQTDLAAAVAKVTVDSSLLHKLVHGPANGTDSQVITEGGTVKTVARAVADAKETLQREIGDLSTVLSSAKEAGTAAEGFAAVASVKAEEVTAALGKANAMVNQAEAEIRTVASAAEADIGGLLAYAEAEAQSRVDEASAAVVQAEAAAAEARAHCRRFSLPIEDVARRALVADEKRLASTRDTLNLFSCFADEAGRSEAAAKASADEAAQHASTAALQVAAVNEAAEAARIEVEDALRQADTAVSAMVADFQGEVTDAKASLASTATSVEGRITATATAFAADVLSLSSETTDRVSAAVAEAEGAATEASAHAARFALPIDALARRALGADARRLADTRHTLILFTAFADEAGRSEAAALASADLAAHHAGIAADQVTAAQQAATSAQAHLTEVNTLVIQADTGLRNLAAEIKTAADDGKAALSAAGASVEDRIAAAAAGFETEVQTLAATTTGMINAAVTHVARFAIPIERIARAALDTEHRRILAARDDLLRFTTILQG